MASKTITIRKDVYDDLVRRKGRESFSGEIRNLLRKKGTLSECAGMWSWMGEKSGDIASSIAERRAASRKLNALKERARKGRTRPSSLIS